MNLSIEIAVQNKTWYIRFLDLQRGKEERLSLSLQYIVLD